MQLHLSTWPEIEDYLARSRGIVIPIGSTEQHGPIGLIGTDALTAAAIAEGVGAAEGALVAPTIAVGMAVHHLAFPGSMTLKPSTLIAMVVDCVQSLAHHGFRRFFFINGHGGNIASLTAAFYEIHAQANGADLRCLLSNWWQPESVQALIGELYGSAEGSHATPSEVAVTWHLHPKAEERRTALHPEVAPTGGFHGPEDFRRRYPDGRIGSNSALATAADGARILEAAITANARVYRDFVAAN